MVYWVSGPATGPHARLEELNRGLISQTRKPTEALSDAMTRHDLKPVFGRKARSKPGLTIAALGIAVVLAATVSSTPTPALAAPACSADKFIAKIGKDLFSAAKSGSYRNFKTIITNYADTSSIGQFALGRYRKSLPEEQAPDYFDLVTEFVARLMAENATQFQGNRFEITRCPEKNKNVAVTSKLHSEIHGVRPVIWRLVKNKGSFRILDVNVHGIWLGVQLRSKFTSVLKKNKGDMNRLYAYLAPQRKALQPVGGQ